jgi:error-prone DNA polymerase
MITPYLEAKHGWSEVSYLHDDLRPILEQTNGVVVFHEQVIEMIACFGGVSNAEADEKRRALGDVEGMAETRLWFFPAALGRGYSLPVVEAVWKVIEAFASFGFCKAHAAAFALPTYQSAWLKAHWPAHFLAGVLTHDPGMYPKRLILEDARQCGIAILGLDVNASEKTYVVERMSSLDEPPPIVLGETSRPDPTERGWPDGRAWGLRLALAEVKGINAGEVERIVSSRPYHSLTDFWHRAQVSRPIAERLVLAGGFDSLYGLGSTTASLGGVRRRTKVTRRDLLLQVAELDRHARAVQRAGRARGLAAGRVRSAATRPADVRVEEAAARASTDPTTREGAAPVERHALAAQGVWARAAAQSRAAADPRPVTSVQLTLDLGDEPQEHVSGLPEMSADERMRAELEILGLDASRHVVDTYAEFLDALGAVRSRDLLTQRSRAEILVAGVKVATQTPPVRSGRRVVFLTLDDGTGPVDATFFEDVQGPYAATVFGSWLLVVRGEVRRTGHRGISLRATGAWPLADLHTLWSRPGPAGGIEAVRAQMAEVSTVADVTHHRVLVHSSGFRMSPYADVKPPGDDTKDVARKLWHRSPGSPG